MMAGDEDVTMQNVGEIEADVELFDGEESSSLDDFDSCTTSVCSTLSNHRFENGRRYHAFREGAYFLPNDKREQDRMEVQHRIYCRLLNGALYRAPLKGSPSRVLDLGTGTGCWALDFASQHPTSQVVGNDLSPIQPTWTPLNCTFEIDDIESEWAYKSRPFDYIHGRDLAGAIGDYDKLFAQAYSNLRPGGYLELQSFEINFFSDDGTKERAVTAVQWQRLLAHASRKYGKELLVEHGWKEKMVNAGFENVAVEVFKIPLGPWPKDPKMRELGVLQARHMNEVLESYSVALFARVLGWSKQELDVLLMSVRNDLANPAAHLYGKFWFVYGEKPRERERTSLE